jgi:uncharacterized protein (DUF924 family)
MNGIAEIVEFWVQAGRDENWFSKSPAFDAAFRAKFLAQHEVVAAGANEEWLSSPDGALALLILMDQFPRNAFRGTARMYATDALARRYARAAIDAGHFLKTPPELRIFLALPFAHSEDSGDQEISVALNASLGEPFLGHAIRHREIVGRFGRFPHRNEILTRVSTTEEIAFLASGGFAG